ncbi:hypothetical protein GCM10011320_59760 [Neoroseomonas lacus]|uniref:Uncharacterized protein n=1 Tax=Neoroseomonas lacus TaxID=287609 RepID=A0A917L868_9PROT|nr:hypothetical protein GCM10011320_59760 [Neoroseomonas lacus]
MDAVLAADEVEDLVRGGKRAVDGLQEAELVDAGAAIQHIAPRAANENITAAPTDQRIGTVHASRDVSV